MKKIILTIILIIIPINIYALSAEVAIAMDAESKRVLYATDIDKEKLIASTTKIMTAIIALENSSLDKEITVGEEILSAYGSAIYIELGETITLEQLLYGLMLRSGNDAAIEIAQLVTGGMDSFVYLMNQKAYELGMINTVFYNNHGLEEDDGSGNTSTAYDMALLMSYAIENETFVTISGTDNYTTETSYKTYSWANKNKLLGMYEYTIAGKTGYTEKALRTLVTAAVKDEKKIVVVTLNDGDDFNDHQCLYETLFTKYERVVVLDKETFNIENSNNLTYYIEKDFVMLATSEEKSSITISYELDAKDEIEDNEQVGVARIKLNDEEIGSVRIYATQKQEESTKKQGFFSKLFGWLFK